jgi:aspartyl protease family protein
MPGAIGFGLLLVGMAILVFTYGETDIAGMAPDQFARVTALAALLLLLSGSVFGQFRGRLGDAFRAIVIWTAILFALIGVYTYRFEVETVVNRLMGELSPGRTTIGEAGEVNVTRGRDGSFIVAGRVEGEPMNFVFDTGANIVVLTADSAARIGYSLEDLDFRVSVMTANGRTLAAPITIDNLTVGDISEDSVRALVARPGALSHNLLGMTFLDRLTSYEVRSNQLILRGRAS